MKWTVFLLFSIASLNAQDFVTGQAARLEVGQRIWSDQYPSATERNLGSISGLAYANNTLFVTDANRVGGTPNNNRILLFGNVNSFIPTPHQELPVSNDRCPACVGSATVVLGQPDFFKTDLLRAAQNITVRTPLGVASNGRYTAVADADFNRVLVWRGIPVSTNQAADLVIGQSDFAGSAPGRANNRLRGPSGVWLDDKDGLWVADTGNSRVLYFGVPQNNGQNATLVLGQPDFNTNVQPQFGTVVLNVANNTLVNPMSVTTDGTRLFVADFGANRVLIWNSIPTTNQAPADTVIGQPNFISYLSNNSSALCASNGTDDNGNATYPDRCGATINFPRFALSDGKRLFISDSGNDRVLVFDRIPLLLNGASADAVLGQQGDTLNQSSESANPERLSASDSLRTPAALAYDGQNLYVADTFNRRVMVFTPGDFQLQLTSVRNAASLNIYAVGNVVVGGTITADDQLTITIAGKDYLYTVVKEDTIASIIDNFVSLINAGDGDPNVVAFPNQVLSAVLLTARTGGASGNDVTLAVTLSTNATETLTTSGANLSGGQDAARIGPFSLISIQNNTLDLETLSVPLDRPLPYELGGVQVYIDGWRAPIQSISPQAITVQISAAVADATSANAIIRVQHKDGTVKVSAPLAVLIIAENPGVFAQPGTDPRPAVAFHASSSATGTIAVDGSAKAGDVGSIVIGERTYSYTVQDGDDLAKIRDALIEIINAGDPEVTASVALPFTTIRLAAKVPGPTGNGISIRASVPEGASLLLTALNSELCCASTAGAPITNDDPAIPGEQITVYATGLGLLKGNPAPPQIAGQPYNGPVPTEPVEFVSALIGGKTARVISCGLKPDAVGIYEVILELNPDLPDNPFTNATIAQSFQVSNIFTIPVVNPKVAP